MMRAAIYARVSTPRQARTQKIDEQLERLEAYVGQKGCTMEQFAGVAAELVKIRT